MSSYFIRTYGCQMNEQDSLAAAQLLRNMGWQPSPTIEAADLILINTCSVREKPVHKISSDLGRLRLLKEANPNLILGVMGCVAQQEKDALLKRCRDLDLVFGPDYLPKLPELIGKIQEDRQAIVETRLLTRADYRFLNLVPDDAMTSTKRAFVNIMKGCDNMCSFCIVPYVRGREVSRTSHDILAEIDHLLDQGVEDIMLLGQNVNSYGLKSTGEFSFTTLLYAIAERARGSTLKWLRFMTPHPKDVGDDLIAAFEKLDILAPHFHLPVQSGSNRILQLMRRAYTRESYLHIVTALKAIRPDIAITTDIIVGFPGETEADLDDTLSLMDAVLFDGSFSFIYSARPYTSAVRLPDPIPLDTKKAWLAKVQDRQRLHSAALNSDWVGKTIELLVETAATSDEPARGRSAHNKVIHFESEIPYTPGDRAAVTVTRTTAAALYGTAT